MYDQYSYFTDDESKAPMIENTAQGHISIKRHRSLTEIYPNVDVLNN